MPIGELARRFGLASHVLRHWEAMELLDPVRDSAGRRRYDGEHVVRIAVILRAKEAGLALEEIRDLLNATGPDERRTRLAGHADQLRRRIAQAQACLDLVQCALDCTHDDLATCPQFRGLVTARIGGGQGPAS